MQTIRYRPRVRRSGYRINKKRFYPFIALIAILAILLILNRIQEQSLYTDYRISELDSEELEMYFDVGDSQGVPWYYLLAIDKAEEIPKEEISRDRSGHIALHLRDITSPKELSQKLKEYNNDNKFIKQINHEIKCMEYLIGVYEDKIFPVAGQDYKYENGYGDERTYGGERRHEGIDIMCDEGTPLFSVCDGVVEKKGWLELGGWRIGIRGKDGVYYYYAHLSRYEDDLEKGTKVKKGQIIGYAGDTGYGSEGTTGQFKPHLHFGMYERSGLIGTGETAVNPYPFLVEWEKKSP